MAGRPETTTDKTPAPDAARRAGCSIKTLNRAIEKGYVRVLGRRGGTGVRYVSIAEVEAWMLGQAPNNSAAPAPRPLPPRRPSAPASDALERIARAAAGGSK